MEPLSLRERIAMTIATRDPLEDWCGKPINWADISEGHRECYRRDADAILDIPGIAVIELPEPDSGSRATDDVNGYVEWQYPHGHIATTDDGTIMWEQWHITDPSKIRAAAAALLAAAEYAERDQ